MGGAEEEGKVCRKNLIRKRKLKYVSRHFLIKSQLRELNREPPGRMIEIKHRVSKIPEAGFSSSRLFFLGNAFSSRCCPILTRPHQSSGVSNRKGSS